MKRFLCIFFLLACVGFLGGAGPTLSIGENMTIDAIGDGGIMINLTLTASQYANWNSKYGSNKSLLKRDMGKFVSQYDTYDWDIKSNDMDRTVNIGIKAHGLVKHLGNGQYEFDVPKDWKGGDRNGSTINYNFIQSDSGMIEQFNCKVAMPANAKDIKDDTGESGQKVIRYSVPLASSNGHWFVLIFGILIAIGGIGIMGIGLLVGIFMGRKKAKAPSGV